MEQRHIKMKDEQTEDRQKIIEAGQAEQQRLINLKHIPWDFNEGEGEQIMNMEENPLEINQNLAGEW